MGVVSSKDRLEIPGLSPSSFNWITNHADQSGLTLVETLRLWDVFLEMGANRVSGKLDETLIRTSFLAHDPIAMKFLDSLPHPDGKLSFLTYLKACHWLQTSSTDRKLRAIFRFENKGENWDYATIKRLVHTLYPSENEQTVRLTADTLMSQFVFGSKNTVDEEDFLKFMGNVDQQTLHDCLNFRIVPPYLNSEPDDRLSDYAPSPHGPPILPPPVDMDEFDDGSLPSDDDLQRVAELMSRRDWRRFVNKLGFTEMDVRLEEGMHRTQEDIILRLLKKWRIEYSGTLFNLKQALNETSNQEVSFALDSESERR